MTDLRKAAQQALDALTLIDEAMPFPVAKHAITALREALAKPAVPESTKAASDVLAERQRQISAEGWTIEHDDEHDDGALSAAASTYALAASDRLNPVRRGIEFGGGRRGPSTWPWSRNSWKYGTPRQMLVKAGALVLAEIERLDRAAPKPKERT